MTTDFSALQPVWIRRFHIRSYEADRNRAARLTTLCNYLQEAAWEHAEHLSFGFDSLAKKHLFWILSRLYIQVAEYPEWTDEVTVETWPKGIDRLFALRDFEIKNKEGTILARASSAWILINEKTKRPEKTDIFRELLEIVPGKSAVDYRFGKLPRPSDPEIKREREVVESDIDVNNHINNVKYIEWITDTFPGNPAELEIHYLAEGFLGETVAIQTEKQEQKIIEGVRTGDGTPLFRAAILQDR